MEERLIASKVPIPAHDEAAVVAQPGEGTFHFPAATVTSELAAVLGLGFDAVGPIRARSTQFYHYTHRTNPALPVPIILESALECARAQTDSRLNGVLVNRYEGTSGHHILRHRDSTADMVDGARVVTISLGVEQGFRRHAKESGHICPLLFERKSALPAGSQLS